MKPARLSPEAYMKICLHASKYNRAAVNGILIAKNRPSETEIKIIDSIPLSHLALANSFTTELALQLVEEYCKESDLSIVGYYQSNTTAEPSLDLVAQRISESLSRDTDNTVFLMISRKLLSDFPSTIAVQRFFLTDGKWSENSEHLSFEGEASSVHAAIRKVSESVALDSFFDFDDHLDDCSRKWLTTDIDLKPEA